MEENKLPVRSIKAHELKNGMYFTHGFGSILQIVNVNTAFDGSKSDIKCRTKFLVIGRYSSGIFKDTLKLYQTNTSSILDNIIDLPEDKITEMVVMERI